MSTLNTTIHHQFTSLRFSHMRSLEFLKVELLVNVTILTYSYTTLFWLVGHRASDIRSWSKTSCVIVCAQFSLYLVLCCLVDSLTSAPRENTNSFPCHNSLNLKWKHATVVASTTQSERLFHWSTTRWVKEFIMMFKWQPFLLILYFWPRVTDLWSILSRLLDASE